MPDLQRRLRGDRRRAVDPPRARRGGAALWRILAELLPAEPEVHRLVALMVPHASRLHARTGPGGESIPLLEQK